MRSGALLAFAGLLALCIGLCLTLLMGWQALSANGLAFGTLPAPTLPPPGKLGACFLAGLAAAVFFARHGAVRRVEGLSSGLKARASTSLSVFLRKIKRDAEARPPAAVPSDEPAPRAPAPRAPEPASPPCPLCGAAGASEPLEAPLLGSSLLVCRGCRPRFERDRLDYARLSPRELDAVFDDSRLRGRLQDERFLVSVAHLYESRGLLAALQSRPVLKGAEGASAMAKALELIGLHEPARALNVQIPSAAASGPEAVVPGAVLHGRYRVVKTLGRGRMGLVFLAQDQKHDRALAVKRVASHLTDDATFRDRLIRAATAAWYLEPHPGIAKFHKIVAHGRRLDLMGEFVEGETLAGVLAARRKLSAAECAAYAREVLEALAWGHERGVAHGGLTPANVMRTREGAVKVVDFGSSANPQAHPAADVYSFGALLGAMAGGDLTDAGLSAELAAACMKQNPAERPTAAALLAAMRASHPRARLNQ